MFVKGVENVVRVIDRDVIYFHFLYYLVVLTTKHEIINIFPSPSAVSFTFDFAAFCSWPSQEDSFYLLLSF